MANHVLDGPVWVVFKAPGKLISEEVTTDDVGLKRTTFRYDDGTEFATAMLANGDVLVTCNRKVAVDRAGDKATIILLKN